MMLLPFGKPEKSVSLKVLSKISRIKYTIPAAIIAKQVTTDESDASETRYAAIPQSTAAVSGFIRVFLISGKTPTAFLKVTKFRQKIIK